MMTGEGLDAVEVLITFPDRAAQLLRQWCWRLAGWAVVHAVSDRDKRETVSRNGGMTAHPETTIQDPNHLFHKEDRLDGHSCRNQSTEFYSTCVC